MSKYIAIAQAIIAGLLIISIMLQRREGGLGSAFGGGDSGGASFSTRRGAEKVVFYATVVFAILFFALAIVRIAA